MVPLLAAVLNWLNGRMYIPHVAPMLTFALFIALIPSSAGLYRTN